MINLMQPAKYVQIDNYWSDYKQQVHINIDSRKKFMKN